MALNKSVSESSAVLRVSNEFVISSETYLVL